MPKTKWCVEYARRMALARALIHEANPVAHLASAQAFVRCLDERFRAALSHHLHCPDRNGVLDRMHDPAFLSRSVIFRLCGWGWNPYSRWSDAAPPLPQMERSAVEVEQRPLDRVVNPAIKKGKRNRPHNVAPVEERE